MFWTLAQAADAVAEKPAEGAAAEAPPAAEAAPAIEKAVNEVVADPVGTVSKWTDDLIAFAILYGPRIIGALLLLFVAWMISNWARRVVIGGFKRAKIDITLGKFFGNLAKWAILLVSIVACMETFGIKSTSFAAVLGAAGLAIGLALQGNLGNLASGVLLLIFRPFKIGDAVVVAGQAGIVDGIDLFTTNLDTPDNRRIIIPNGAIFGGVIENQSTHARRCVAINIPVSGATPLEQSQAIFQDVVMRVVQSTPGALAEPAPGVALAELLPTVTWGLTVWAETGSFLAVRQALLREIKAAIDQNKLAPPAPAMDIRVVSMPRPE